MVYGKLKPYNKGRQESIVKSVRFNVVYPQITLRSQKIYRTLTCRTGH